MNNQLFTRYYHFQKFSVCLLWLLQAVIVLVCSKNILYSLLYICFFVIGTIFTKAIQFDRQKIVVLMIMDLAITIGLTLIERITVHEFNSVRIIASFVLYICWVFLSNILSEHMFSPYRCIVIGDCNRWLGKYGKRYKVVMTLDEEDIDIIKKVVDESGKLSIPLLLTSIQPSHQLLVYADLNAIAVQIIDPVEIPYDFHAIPRYNGMIMRLPITE